MTNPVVNLSIFAGAGAQFFDNNGLPLAGGLIYTYSSGTTTPQTTYTTVAATAQNSNPIVLDASGRTPQEIWLLNGYSYKFVLQTSVGTQIGSYDNIPSVSTNLPIINDASSVSYEQGNITTAGSFIVGGIYLITSIGTTNFITIGAGSNTVGVLFTATGVGSGTGTAQLATTVQAKLQEYVSVFDFMTATQISGVQAGTYTNDLSVPIQFAFNTGKKIYFPAGTYYFNATVINPTIIYGDGTINTFLYPYNSSAACITYNLSSPSSYQWAYHTVISNVTFNGTSGTTTSGGVGFTVGSTDPTVYTTNQSNIGFITFNNCRFISLYKGIQRPSGNLALQITSCNFASCYYGTYNVQGKGIPPGQFFLLNGETDSCLCGHYFDVQQDGLGQISFDNHVFEANSICARIKQPTSSNLYAPIMFRNCWNEANGLYRSGGPSTTTLDVWVNTGAAAVRTTETVSCTYPYVMSVNQIEWNGGFCAGFSLASASNCLMKINNARVECTAGANSSPFYIDPADAQTCILMENCITAVGFPQINNCIDYDRNRCLDISLNGNATRARFLQQMWNISTGTNQIGFNQTFQTAQTWSNGAGLVATGSVITGNAIYSSVNNFAYTSPTGSQQYNFSNTQATVSAGYIVVTFQLFAVNLGSLNFNVWNSGVAPYVVSITPIADSAWHTYGGIAYGNSPFTVNLGATSNDSTAQSINFSISAYQIKRFSTQVQAEDFLYSRTYLA